MNTKNAYSSYFLLDLNLRVENANPDDTISKAKVNKLEEKNHNLADGNETTAGQITIRTPVYYV